MRQGPSAGVRGVGPGEDETLGVDGDARGQPAGAGLCADEDEDRRAVEIARAARLASRSRRPLTVRSPSTASTSTLRMTSILGWFSIRRAR